MRSGPPVRWRESGNGLREAVFSFFDQTFLPPSPATGQADLGRCQHATYAHSELTRRATFASRALVRSRRSVSSRNSLLPSSRRIQRRGGILMTSRDSIDVKYADPTNTSLLECPHCASLADVYQSLPRPILLLDLLLLKRDVYRHLLRNRGGDSHASRRRYRRGLSLKLAALTVGTDARKAASSKLTSGSQLRRIGARSRQVYRHRDRKRSSGVALVCSGFRVLPPRCVPFDASLRSNALV